MKFSKKIIVVAVVVVMATFSMNAGLRFGVKAGLGVNDLHFNESVFDGSNRAGFTGGIMTEFTVPVVGIGFDASLMYVRRNSNTDINVSSTSGTSNELTNNRDYIEIPINLKYKIGLPIVGKVITPYLFTGPSFAFLTSKKDVKEFFKNKSCDISWNFGFGVELLSHLQIGASYGMGISKAVELFNVNDNAKSIDGKTRVWTITAAYLF